MYFERSMQRDVCKQRVIAYFVCLDFGLAYLCGLFLQLRIEKFCAFSEIESFGPALSKVESSKCAVKLGTARNSHRVGEKGSQRFRKTDIVSLFPRCDLCDPKNIVESNEI